MNTSKSYLNTSSDERFELVEHLGAGGFAHTYKARVLNKEIIEDYGTDIVALKIPLNDEKERQLHKEVELNAHIHLVMTEVKSINIIRYLGFNVFRGQVVMVMEYAHSGSLRKRLGKIGRQNPIPFGEAVEIVKGILSGLKVMHKAHIFHRDIKPENILMVGDCPKISDLGIARMLESHELASTTTGTLYYMSPEMLSEEGASFTADLWSIGVTFYEMVTGELPFYSLAVGKTLDMIRTHKQKPASVIHPEVPLELNKIIEKALEKDPIKRYRSAEEMLIALTSFQQGKSCEIEQQLSEITDYSLEKADITEKKLRSIVAKYPDNPKVYQCLGEFLNRCQRYKEAIQVFMSGLDINPESAMLYWDISLAYLGVNKWQESIRNIEKALSSGLDENYQQHAINLLKKLRANNQDRVNPATRELVEVANNQLVLEEKNLTERKLIEIMKKYPDEPTVYQTVGEFYNLCQRHTEAIKMFTKGLKLAPKNALLLWDIAMAYLGTNKRTDAINALNKAITLDLDEGRRRHAVNLINILQRNCQ